MWERLDYDWSNPHHVVLTTTDSNLFGGASGSHLHPHTPARRNHRHRRRAGSRRKKPQGTRSSRACSAPSENASLTKAFGNSVKAIETRSASKFSATASKSIRSRANRTIRQAIHSRLTFESRGIDMRAIQMEQFGDPAQVLRVVDIEEPPPPGPHEVLVSVEVSPLNKHDLLVVSGMLARPPLPHIPRRRGGRPRACHWRRGRWTSGRRSGRATPVCRCVA